MNELNKFQKRIRIVGIVCGVIPLEMGFFGDGRGLLLLPLAFTLMFVDIGIAIYKRFNKGEKQMSEDPNFSIEWHKGFQVGLYSGKHTQQERIIKLLEAEGCHCTPDPEAGKCYPHNIIALIKGENK